jgi:transposase
MAYRSLAAAEKKAVKKGLVIVFIDEAGFYLLPSLVRSYAPRGETPILRARHSYDHLSVMSGITLSGQLYTLMRSRALTSKDSVRFLKQVRQQVKQGLLVIWDGSPIHRREVTQYMSTKEAKDITLEQLPGYAPDLNPDEGVWQHLKNVELRNLSCKSLDHLHRELNLAIRRLRNKPHIIRSFFDGAGLSIET